MLAFVSPYRPVYPTTAANRLAPVALSAARGMPFQFSDLMTSAAFALAGAKLLEKGIASLRDHGYLQREDTETIPCERRFRTNQRYLMLEMGARKLSKEKSAWSSFFAEKGEKPKIGGASTFVQNEGYMEQKFPAHLSMPSSNGLSADMKQATILQYKTQIPSSYTLDHEIPLTAIQMKALPVGSFLELRLQGQLNEGGGISLRPIVPGAFSAASFDLMEKYAIQKDVVLRVLKVQDPGLVYMEIANSDIQSIGLNAIIRACHVNLPFSFEHESLLQAVTEGRVNLPLSSLADDVSSKVGFEWEKSKNKEHERSFFLDLSSEATHPVYEEMLHLHLSAGIKAAHNNELPVKEVSGLELKDEKSGYLKVLGFNLFQHGNSRSSKTSTTTFKEIKRIVKNEQFKKDFSSIFSGKQNILWEGVSISGNGPLSGMRFFHLKVEEMRKSKDRQMIKDYLALAKGLGVDLDRLEYHKAPEVNGLTSFISPKDDLSATLDLYLTRYGVEELVAADFESAGAAWLKMLSESDPNLSGLGMIDRHMFQEVVQLAEAFTQSQNRIDMFDYLNAKSSLVSAYHDLTQRDLHQDASHILEAKQFGQVVGIDIGETEDMGKFFADFGEKKGFDYMKTIMAISQLIGNEEVLVNQLSLNGAGVALESVSEGVVSSKLPKIFDPLLDYHRKNEAG